MSADMAAQAKETRAALARRRVRREGEGGVSEEEIAELERLSQEAAPGPWEEHPNGGRIADARGIPAACADGYSREERDRNRALIAAARNALPRLLAEVRRLRAAMQPKETP